MKSKLQDCFHKNICSVNLRTGLLFYFIIETSVRVCKKDAMDRKRGFFSFEVV